MSLTRFLAIGLFRLFTPFPAHNFYYRDGGELRCYQFGPIKQLFVWLLLALAIAGPASGAYFYWKFSHLEKTQASLSQELRLAQAAVPRTIITGENTQIDPTLHRRLRDLEGATVWLSQQLAASSRTLEDLSRFLWSGRGQIEALSQKGPLPNDLEAEISSLLVALESGLDRFQDHAMEQRAEISRLDLSGPLQSELARREELLSQVVFVEPAPSQGMSQLRAALNSVKETSLEKDELLVELTGEVKRLSDENQTLTAFVLELQSEMEQLLKRRDENATTLALAEKRLGESLAELASVKARQDLLKAHGGDPPTPADARRLHEERDQLRQALQTAFDALRELARQEPGRMSTLGIAENFLAQAPRFGLQ